MRTKKMQERPPLEREERQEVRELAFEILSAMGRLGYTPAMIESVGRHLLVASETGGELKNKGQKDFP